jgi:hypothetical protein
MTSQPAQEWHELAQHLTQQHGTNPAAIVAYGPALPQLQREHWAAHVSGDAAGLVFRHTPRPHVPPEPIAEGQPQRTPGMYAPFTVAPQLQGADPWCQPEPEPEADR